jgi:hypothetical protein
MTSDARVKWTTKTMITGLWKVVDQFVANTNLHPTSPNFTVSWCPRYPSASALNRHNATGGPGSEARFNECQCVPSTYLVRVPTSNKPIDGIVATRSGEEWPRLPLASRT